MKPRCPTCGNACPCSCVDYDEAVRELEHARETSKSLIEQAREKREREAWKQPILDAFDRLNKKGP